MICEHCGRPGKKAFNGYCTKVHQQLNKAPDFVMLECANCGAPVRRTPSRISKGGKAFCGRCSKNTGETHPRWREGQYIDKAGYRHILVKETYVREHVFTWERANRSCVLPEAHGIVHIHHINTNKADNRPINLVLLSSQMHGRIHRYMDSGKWKEAKCLLLKSLEQQVYFLEHTEDLEFYRDSDLRDILSAA